MVGRLISNIGEGFTARWLAKKQKKELDNLKESDFIPPSLLQAESLASKNTNASRYAGQDIDEANIRQSSANAVSNVSRATTSSTNLVNAAMGIQGNENRAMQGVSKTMQNFKDRNQANWTRLLLLKANAQAGNRRQYEASKSALQGAIMQNKARQRNAFWNAGGSALDSGLAFAAGGGGMKGLEAITGGTDNSLAVMLQRMGIN
jgi:hypothetical protein